MQKYDLVVIGGGPSGYVAAIRAAQLGAKVALIEKDRVGGTCLNRGCIPTKAIIACVNLYEKIKQAQNYGITCGSSSIDLEKVIARKEAIVAKTTRSVEFLLNKNKVDIIYGTAKVLEPGKVEIEAKGSSTLLGASQRQKAEGKRLILATGSSPACLPGIGFDNERFLSSDDMLNITEVPAKLEIVGGGVIGIHFAQIFSALGTEITIHEALPEILPGVDEEVIAKTRRIFKRQRIKIITGAKFDPAKATGKILICIGRSPNLSGLENLALKMDGRCVWVNEKMETSVPGVYAAGDLVSSKQFAHVAYEQGVIAAENALGASRSFKYDCVPYGIYTHPEIGSVGLTEKEAKEKHGNVKIGKFNYAALGIANAMGEIEGFIKVIIDNNSKLLGVHILGAEATTLIGSATIALKNRLTVNQLADTFQAHPSYPEGLQEAALSSLSRALHALNQDQLCTA